MLKSSKEARDQALADTEAKNHTEADKRELETAKVDDYR